MPLVEYDMRVFYLSDTYYRLLEISCLEPMLTGNSFRVKGTVYCLTAHSFYEYSWYSMSKDQQEYVEVTFEYVLDNSPIEVQQELLFNINIFIKNKREKK